MLRNESNDLYEKNSNARGIEEQREKAIEAIRRGNIILIINALYAEYIAQIS